MPRTIQPELLDTLAPEHPDALHSRRDLRFINRFMGNHRWITRHLPRRLRPQERVLEIGAGTGELSERLRSAGVSTHALDLVPPPENWPRNAMWHRADLKSFEHYADYPVIVGNLIFHHLNDDELADLGTRFSNSARVIVACEPIRRRFSQLVFRVLGPVFGVSHVTMHDGLVSIAGGFARDELPRALGLKDADWAIEQFSSALGGYRMIAIRRE